MDVSVIEADVLILGGGFAAVRAAIEAGREGCRTAIVSKGPIGKSGASPMAGGAMMAALGIADPRDNPRVHFQDTITSGRGLADPDLVRIMCDEAAARALELRDYGMDLYAKDGQIVQTHEPGHTYPRSVRSLGGGVAFIVPLQREAKSNRNVFFYEDVMATRLLVHEGRVVGATALNIQEGRLLAFIAPATIVATGGYQDLYPTSDAAPDATGDGYSLAFDVGAELLDMEMLLYYPTALVYPPSARGTLISYEYFLNKQGMNASLVNAAGEELVSKDEPLPTRDVLSRRIFEEVRRGQGTPRGGVYVDFGRSPWTAEEQENLFKQRAPSVFNLLSSIGIAMVNSRLEVAPAAHYVLGGIKINGKGETGVPGLFAAGEVAGNIHGANRLAGNAITEVLVFGRRAGYFAAQCAHEYPRPRVPRQQIQDDLAAITRLTQPKDKNEDPGEVKTAIRRVMLDYVGPTRTEEHLQQGLEELRRLAQDRLPRLQVAAQPEKFNYPLVEALEAHFMTSVGMLACRAALLRRESRGHHFRADFPATNDVDPVNHTSLMLRSGETVATLYPTGQ